MPLLLHGAKVVVVEHTTPLLANSLLSRSVRPNSDPVHWAKADSSLALQIGFVCFVVLTLHIQRSLGVHPAEHVGRKKKRAQHENQRGKLLPIDTQLLL